MTLDDGVPTAPVPVGVHRPFTSSLARIGPYRVIRPLGEGGMGVVYLAQQDTPVRREVAIKVLRPGSYGANVVARFESERQVLALMDHPNITRVYDAGVSDDGLPYFVMECVSGVPITEYVDAHHLPIRERVQLFLQVCHAVQHAHQKGIIHRDIKPSNVLVTEADGTPRCKVIDFGIAKAIEPAADATRLTATGIAIGTPAYMSPEQLVGGGVDADTRTDIYSLGVLLYELLTGVLPLEPGAQTGWALATMYAMTDAPPPSVRYGGLDVTERVRMARDRDTDPATLQRALHGDLDAVLLKALESDRERRYATANDFARDLEHYLRDEPVAATPPSRTYRMRKFVRRHRVGAALGGSAVLLFLAFSLTVAVQARRLARAEHVAVARQAQAEELIGFMLGDLYARLTPVGKLDLLDAVARRALAYFAAVPETDLSDAETYRRAQALQELGQVRMAQGTLPEATGLLAQALALSTRLVARDSTNAVWQVGLGRAHFWAGNVAWERGNVDAALAHFVPFVRISEQLIARYPDSTRFRSELASALSNIGSAHEAKGDLGGGLRAYREALTLDQAIARRDTNPDARRDLAFAYNTVGVAQRKLGDIRGALASHDAELALWQGLTARDSSDQEIRGPLAHAYAFRSLARMAGGDADGALADARSARDLLARLAAHDTSNMGSRLEYAALQDVVAQDLVVLGDARAALPEVEASIARVSPLAAAANPNQRAVRILSSARTTLGRVLWRLGRTAEARVAVREAVAGGEHALTGRPQDLEQRRVLGDASLVLGDLLAHDGDTASARVAWSRTLTVVDSAARASGYAELRALAATARFDLGDDATARPIATALVDAGYRKPSFVQLARSRGVVTSP